MTRTDRVALVTGAARGQGAAIVQRLRADGFRVAACDVLADELHATVDALGDDGVIAVPLDVTSPSGVAAGRRGRRRAVRSLTTLVNNAGVLHRASLADETAEGFERQLAGQLPRRRSWASGPRSTICAAPKAPRS